MYICQKQAEKFEEAWIRFIWLVTMSYQTLYVYALKWF